jgi:hypothetical protein
MTVPPNGLTSRIEAILKALPPAASSSYMDELQHLNDDCVTALDTQPEALLCCLFANAIKEHYRTDGQQTGHLYLERYEVPQIKLFDTLITKFPFVTAAHSISNHLIAKWLEGQPSAVVLDIGLGRGIQMAALINKLAANSHLQELTIVGIEPFQDAIEHATSTIQQAAQAAPFKVNLHILEGFAENISYYNLKKLFPADYTRLIVNGSLSVHHIPSVELRNRFFSQVKFLLPHAIILTEPHTNHMTSDWNARAANAWIHYGAIFNTIDSLQITAEEKNGLKMFFGREIKDVVATADNARFERHEPNRHWISYGQQIGMTLERQLTIPRSVFSDTTINISYNEGTLMMNRHQTGVLAIIPLVNSLEN